MGKVLHKSNQMGLVWCSEITPHLLPLRYLITYEVEITIRSYIVYPNFDDNLQPNDISFVLSNIVGNAKV